MSRAALPPVPNPDPRIAAVCKPERKRFRLHPLCLPLILALLAKVVAFPAPGFNAGIFYAVHICVGLGSMLIPAVLALAAFWIGGRSAVAGNLVFGLLIAVMLAGQISFHMHSKQFLEGFEEGRREAAAAGLPTMLGRPAAHKKSKSEPIVRVYRR